MYFTRSAKYALPYYGSKPDPALLICLLTPGTFFSFLFSSTTSIMLMCYVRSFQETCSLLSKVARSPSPIWPNRFAPDIRSPLSRPLLSPIPFLYFFPL